MTAHRYFVILALAALVGLAACGRKAPLDTPYQAALDAREEAEENDEPLPPEPDEPERDRPFILDPLIQ